MRRVLSKYLQSREVILLLLLVAACSGFSIFTEGFWGAWNLSDRSRHWVEIGLIAIGMTFIISTAGIDLSVGSTMALCGVCGGLVWTQSDPGFAVVFLTALAIGGGCGLFNGLLIVAGGIPPLVATLATMAVFRGLAYGLTEAQPVSGFPDWFTDWGNFTGWSISERSAVVPWPFLIMLGFYAGGAMIYHRHVLGRRVRQVGENAVAFRFAGNSLKSPILIIYTATGLLCGLAGIVWMSRFATAHPRAGLGLELEVIAVVILGGTGITGGRGSVIGTLLGLILLGMVKYGMDLEGITQQRQAMFIGVLLIATAMFNEWSARRSSAA